MRTVKFGKPLLGDAGKQAVADVLEGDILVHGPKAGEFEAAFAEFTEAPYALSMSSCTAALHLSYFHFGIGAGDEVICPAMSHVATAHAIELVGAKPVFVDADPATGNINIDLIEAAITPQTKAITLVHFLGMPVAMDRIMAIASKHNLYVIEDCALAVGSKYKGTHAGLWGDMGCFSFYPVKHITTAEGGMLITKHEAIASKMKFEKAFGVDRTQGERKIPGHYDVKMLGFNYRMSEVHAAMGIEQMKVVDGFLAARKTNYHTLESGLQGINGVELLTSTHGDFESSYYCLTMVLSPELQPRRTEIIDALNALGIGTSIYYPSAIPGFTYYREKYGYRGEDWPVAHRIATASIALPVAPHLDVDDMNYVADGVRQVIASM